MNLDRTKQPQIRDLDKIGVPFPERNLLPNGIPLYIIRAGDQDVVRLDLVFKGGSWHQTQNLQALFTNRMLREGTRSYTSADIAEKLDYYGAWLELSSSMEYAYITLYSLNKYFQETLAIIESIIKEPVFPEKELSRVAETNLQQFQVNKTKVDYMAHRSMLIALFGEEHPCGELLVEEDYQSLHPEVLKSFYETHYMSCNCHIYISGKVTPTIIDCIEKTFGQEIFGGGKFILKEPNAHIEVTPEKRIFTECPDSMQSAIKLATHSLTRMHPDYNKFRVLLTLFGGYFGSRLMTNIREDKGYTYGISAGMIFYPDSSLFAVTTETDNEFVDPLISEVYYEIDRLHHELVSEEELALVKNYMLGEMVRSYESAFSLSDAWMFIQTTGLPDDFFEHALQAIKETTSQDINKLACRYLRKESIKEIIAGKKKS